ncbi:MAG TPA: helix-turn-helix domain-containing protein [Bryobacteraceae bacterium]|nr:helix-turn-helix domain-containing protein [Bryobacteraceae bacterium]
MNATDEQESPLQATEPGNRVPMLERDRKEILDLYAAIRRRKAKLVGPTGEEMVLPDSLHAFLVALISLLSEGKSVYLVQNQAKLTTVEAAAMLGVSRQFLINLLKKEEIPYHKVGTHRRIYARDLLRYKHQRDARRKEALRELSRSESSEGLYNKVPASLADAD